MLKALFSFIFTTGLMAPLAFAQLGALGSSIKKSPGLIQKTLYNGTLAAGTELSTIHRFAVKVFPSDYSAHCTGVLIQDRFVMLAAHCLSSKKSLVVQAALDEKGSKFEYISVQDIFEHPKAQMNGGYAYGISEYNANTYQDVAVLLLSKSPDFLKPIHFLDDNMSKLANYIPQSRLVGFNRLKDFTVTNSLGTIEFTDVYRMESSNYLYYTLKGDQGICHGDSGGPLILTIRKEHYLVGVASALHGASFKDLPNGTYKTKDGEELSRCGKFLILQHTGMITEWVRSSMVELANRNKLDIPTDLGVFDLQ